MPAQVSAGVALLLQQLSFNCYPLNLLLELLQSQANRCRQPSKSYVAGPVSHNTLPFGILYIHSSLCGNITFSPNHNRSDLFSNRCLLPSINWSTVIFVDTEIGDSLPSCALLMVIWILSFSGSIAGRQTGSPLVWRNWMFDLLCCCDSPCAFVYQLILKRKTASCCHS